MARGTETLKTPHVVPRGQILSDKDTRRAGVGAGSGTRERDGRDWSATDNGWTSNDGGNPITVLDLSTINAGSRGLSYRFPGEAADDNSWWLDWAVPGYMHAAEPNMKIRLYILIEP